MKAFHAGFAATDFERFQFGCSTGGLSVKYRLVFWQLTSKARSLPSLGDVGKSVSGQVTFLSMFLITNALDEFGCQRWTK